MTVTRTRDGVPGWSGDPSTWIEFKQAARLYMASTKVENRYTCGPKIAAELTGAAKTAITGKKSTWLSDSNGVEVLLQFLQQTIGEPALPEVGNFMRQYFKVLRRKRGEAMSAFCVRHREEYERMCRSLARMVKEHRTRTKLSSQSSSKVGTEAAASQAGGDEHLEGGEPPAATPQDHQEEVPWNDDSWWSWQYGQYGWSSWSWGNEPWRQTSWRYSQPQSSKWPSSSKSATGAPSEAEIDDEDKVDILPDAVLGWFLLEKSNFDSLEKSVIQGEIKGDFTLAGVEHALRSHWPDDQVKRRDGDAKHTAAFQEDAEDEKEPEEDDAALFEDWPPEDVAFYQDAKADEEKAWVHFQQARRTLREARARQHEVKLSRKYYKTSFSGGRAFSGAIGAKPNHGQKGPCFKCGAMGHQAKDCPKRDEKAQWAEEDGEMAEFTYFTHEEQSDREFEPDDTAYWGQQVPPTTEQAIMEGKAVIDGGATKTMASVYALEQLTNANLKKRGITGVAKIDAANRPTFGFGNSERTQCVSACQVQVPNDKQKMNFQIHVLNQGRAPVLLSVDTLRKLGAIIDFTNDQAVFTSVAPNMLVDLERSQAGHQLFPLAEDFCQQGRVCAKAVNSLASLMNE